jgi:hypothetical protein
MGGIKIPWAIDDLGILRVLPFVSTNSANLVLGKDVVGLDRIGSS